MQPADYPFLVLLALIIIALFDSDSGPGGGKRSRVPVSI